MMTLKNIWKEKNQVLPSELFLAYKYWNCSCIVAVIQITLPELVYPEEITFVVTNICEICEVAFEYSILKRVWISPGSIMMYKLPFKEN